MALLDINVLPLLLGAAILYQIASSISRPSRPPGPRGYPLIGNFLDMPPSFEWLTFSEWRKKYGDIVSVTVFGTTVIVLNSYGTAQDILEDNPKASIYSSRPHIPMTADLMGWRDVMGLLPYGPKLRNARRFFHKEIGSNNGVKNFHTQLEEQARAFIRLVNNRPDGLLEHLFHHSGAIILRIAYGYKADDAHDKLVEIGNEAMETFNRSALPGQYLVNQIPILKYVPEWVPGARFQKEAREWRALFRDMIDVPFAYTRSEMERGTAEDSFVSKWLRTGLLPQERKELAHAAGSMFAAGGDTTAVTLYFFFIVMASYPSIAKRAREEMDRNVGQDRFPNFDDRASLPYLEALTKEVMRWHALVPLSVPRTTLEDDIRDGYYIPKGSIVLTNIWEMCHDHETYPSPHIFNPDRFLGSEPQRDPRNMVFGFGRRLCPGRLLADASIYITLAMTVWSFDIHAANQTVETMHDVQEGDMRGFKAKPGIISHLERVPLSIVPRTDRQKLAELVLR